MINKSKILELIKRQKDTGLTITAICVNEGIDKSTFYYWLKKPSKEQGKDFILFCVKCKQIDLIFLNPFIDFPIKYM
jgi:hypothetical protein